MKTSVASLFAVVAGVSAGYTPSFITCKDSNVKCQYGYDPHMHVSRCKPWDGSDFACSKICCAGAPPPPPPPPPPPSPPSFITCKESKVACKYGYNPKVIRCKPWDGSDYACSKLCCAPPPPPPPSFVRCDSKEAHATCSGCPHGYKADPKVGGVMRCKLWAGSTQHCSPQVCCKPPPPPPPPPKPQPPPHPKPQPPTPPPKPSSLIPCDSAKANVACKDGYKHDPKTHGVMRCKLWAGSTVHCSAATCCAPPPPPPKPSTYIRCDKASPPPICPYGFKKDPKDGGVMRCKTWPGSTVECNAITCCAPQHY